MKRRNFIKQSGAGLAGLCALGAANPFVTDNRNGPNFNTQLNGPFFKNPRFAEKVIIIGMDGMDPHLTRRFIQEGVMPTFAKFVETNHFGTLQTTNPPQSPVAWASFISGCNPGGTGVFDFIHRDPKSLLPFLSISRSYNPKKSFKVGSYNIPLESGRVENRRFGPYYWKYLEANSIYANVFQIPSNFPVTPGASETISGMGTPDLIGSYGTCTLYSETPVEGSDKFDGARVSLVKAVNNSFDCQLVGPKNSFRTNNESATVDFTINRDPIEKVIRIDVQGQELVLKEGEWSEWVTLKFELLPLLASASGIVRFHVKQVHPELKVYASPINIDPMDPTLPISSPAGYSKELAQAVGRFYTQGFPADTKALSLGILTDEEYIEQAKIVFEENMRSLDHLLNKFDQGCFFYYFSNIDQNSHMLMRCMDPSHPQYNPNASDYVKNSLKSFYIGMDRALKRVLEKVDSKTALYILSDHGFAKFHREFNLSTWLVKEGFCQLNDLSKLGQGEFYRHVNWKNTKAYALGINGIYLNYQDREGKRGSVFRKDGEKIKQNIIAKLQQLVDPKTGKKVVLQAYDAAKIYSGPYAELAPDIVVGYADGYRISDEAVLGKFPTEVIADRTNKWSSDHCLDPSVVPGVIFSNRKPILDNPGLWDMAPTILDAFGIPTPKEMDGKVAFGV